MSMHVLVVHNRYRSVFPSGENAVVAEEIELLRNAGMRVSTYLRSSDEIGEVGLRRRAGLAIETTYSARSIAEIEQILRSGRPDVVHLHNAFPLISPWIVRTAKRAGVPIVQTVHNYRHVCPAGTYFRDGQLCEDCVGKRVPWPAVAHACYGCSRTQSLALATALAIHRRTWAEVDKYIAVSSSVADHLVRFGIPEARVVVKPNSTADPGPPAPLGVGFLYAARLDEAKGVLLLLDAWERSGLGTHTRLVLAGDGPVRREVERRAAQLMRVSYVGALSPEGVLRLVDQAAVVVVPSLWHEPFGLGVIEAFARGRPVVATNRGALRDLVDDEVGWSVEADVDSMSRALCRAHTDAGVKSAPARRRFEGRFRPEADFSILAGVFAEVVAARQGCF